MIWLINCRKDKILNSVIYFAYYERSEHANSLLFMDKVKSYQYGYCKDTIAGPDKSPVRNEYHRFRAAISGGYGYRTAKISE